MRANAAATVAALAVAGAMTIAPAHPRQPTFSARSDLVVLHVMVKEHGGAYVRDLPADAFTVIEDGRRQDIEFFASEDTPATVGLIIDSSGSMERSRPRVLAAVETFAETSNPEDELCALTFNEVVRSALPPEAPFTASPTVLRQAVATAINARGRTALHDAIAAGLQYVAHGGHRRTALVVLSDGGDNASAATFDDVLRLTQISNTVIYTVALVDRLRRDTNPKQLKAIAVASGGEAYEPESIDDVPDVLRAIATDLRHSYTIGYTPTNVAKNGLFRRVQVKVEAPNLHRPRIRAREGYFVEGR